MRVGLYICTLSRDNGQGCSVMCVHKLKLTQESRGTHLSEHRNYNFQRFATSQQIIAFCIKFNFDTREILQHLRGHHVIFIVALYV